MDGAEMAGAEVTGAEVAAVKRPFLVKVTSNMSYKRLKAIDESTIIFRTKRLIAEPQNSCLLSSLYDDSEETDLQHI
uniref:Uncharacterized protein n=1 Tax=Romanomermis culicivorax TaxID=13658 RepID=A0A915KRL1_ROMCU